jgi:hypothetical protein
MYHRFPLKQKKENKFTLGKSLRLKVVSAGPFPVFEIPMCPIPIWNQSKKNLQEREDNCHNVIQKFGGKFHASTVGLRGKKGGERWR